MKPLTMEEMASIRGGSTPGSCAFVTGMLAVAVLTMNPYAGALATFYLGAYCYS